MEWKRLENEEDDDQDYNDEFQNSNENEFQALQTENTNGFENHYADTNGNQMTLTPNGNENGKVDGIENHEKMEDVSFNEKEKILEERQISESNLRSPSIIHTQTINLEDDLRVYFHFQFHFQFSKSKKKKKTKRQK